jgi:ABC-type long-subunit fatty acid transport system fused permease/ATPase subunit
MSAIGMKKIEGAMQRVQEDLHKVLGGLQNFI